MSDISSDRPRFGNPAFPPPGSPFDPDTTADVATSKRGRRSRAPKEPKARKPKPTKASKQASADRPPVRRVASTNRTVGILLAIVAMAIVGIALTSKSHQTYVVRANTAIGALQTFNVSEVTAFATPASNIQTGAITGKTAKAALALAKKDLKNTYAQFPIAKDEQISTSLFSGNGKITTGQISPNQRLMAVQADIGAAAAGVRVGSYVDVVGVTTATSPALAGIIVSHVEVMAIAPPESTISTSAATANSKLPATSIGGTYVLLIPAREETRLASVAGSGDSIIYLTYASSSATAPDASTMSVIQTICGTNDPLHESGTSTQQLPTGCQ